MVPGRILTDVVRALVLRRPCLPGHPPGSRAPGREAEGRGWEGRGHGPGGPPEKIRLAEGALDGCSWPSRAVLVHPTVSGGEDRPGLFEHDRGPGGGLAARRHAGSARLARARDRHVSLSASPGRLRGPCAIFRMRAAAVSGPVEQFIARAGAHACP